MIRGLREKTFRKDFIRTHMEKYGEIVKISSGLHNGITTALTDLCLVQGHARAVMVRFADYKSAVKVHKDVNNPDKKVHVNFVLKQMLMLIDRSSRNSQMLRLNSSNRRASANCPAFQLLRPFRIPRLCPLLPLLPHSLAFNSSTPISVKKLAWWSSMHAWPFQSLISVAHEEK